MGFSGYLMGTGGRRELSLGPGFRLGGSNERRNGSL